MLRAWIISFLAVGLVVGAILFFTQEKTPDADTPDKPPVNQTKPQSLTANDVLKYLEVFPDVNATMYEVAKSGQANRETMLAAIRPMLATHQLSPESWDKLWRRVEDVVNAIRVPSTFLSIVDSV